MLLLSEVQALPLKKTDLDTISVSSLIAPWIFCVIAVHLFCWNILIIMAYLGGKFFYQYSQLKFICLLLASIISFERSLLLDCEFDKQKQLIISSYYALGKHIPNVRKQSKSICYSASEANALRMTGLLFNYEYSMGMDHNRLSFIVIHLLK